MHSNPFIVDRSEETLNDDTVRLLPMGLMVLHLVNSPMEGRLKKIQWPQTTLRLFIFLNA